MKRFLLVAGACYYPQSGDGDWVGFFDTREEAEKLITSKKEYDYFMRGPRKGTPKSPGRDVFYVSGRRVDWYDIIDIAVWSRS